MAAISREEERAIKEWQERGGRCIDRIESFEDRIARNEIEIANNLRKLRKLRGAAQTQEEQG